MGRYVVGRVVGEGAMGVVHEAYDPELDRTVAVKVLHDSDDRNLERRSRRLQREAQALAQLNHPNVVTIHDVGQHQGRVFIAMEFVAGQTVRSWLRAETRTWTEVLDVFCAAAGGLAAAHDQGLVHRDFKPANVMIAEDGRIVVMDFGLARVDFSTDGSAPSRPGHGLSDSRVLDAAPTQDGPLVGTPAYISPEQHLGRKADARSDQFAFCVSLWEGLYGSRPFTGRTVGELMAKVLDGSPESPPAGRDVPRWLVAVAQRGLSRDPRQRFGSMHALLEALRRGRLGRPRRAGLKILGALAALAAAVQVVGVVGERRREAICERDASPESWSEQARRSVHDGVAGHGSTYSAETADRVVSALDQHAQAWTEASERACLAATVDEVPGWNEELYDRAQWCLGARQAQLHSLVEQLTDPDAVAVQRAPFAVGRLEDPALCADPEVLRALQRPPLQYREDVDAIEAELHRATVLSFVGSYPDGLRASEVAVRRAREIGFAPLVARAECIAGRLLFENGQHEAAREALESAHYGALEAADHETALDTANDLASLHGVTMSSFSEGWAWIRHAESALARLPDPSGLRAAEVAARRAAILAAEGNYEESQTVRESVLKQYVTILGEDHPQVGLALQAVANNHHKMGNYERAQELFTQAVDVFKAGLGPEHPQIAKSMSNLALVLAEQGRYVQAKEYYEGALRLLERGLGREHPDLGVVLSNLGVLLEQLGDLRGAKQAHTRALELAQRANAGPAEIATALHNVAGMDYTLGNYDRAREQFERVVALLERTFGPRHPQVAAALQMLALTADTQGDGAYAYSVYERALEIVRESLGPEHPDVAALQNGLASIDMDEGRYDIGRRRFDEALAIERKTLGELHPSLMSTYNNVATLEHLRGRYEDARLLFSQAKEVCDAHSQMDTRTCSYPIFGLARVALEQGRASDALTLAERALSMRPVEQSSPAERADVQFVLARALWRTGGDRGRAVALAQEAAAVYRTQPLPVDELEEIETWLRRHRRPT